MPRSFHGYPKSWPGAKYDPLCSYRCFIKGECEENEGTDMWFLPRQNFLTTSPVLVPEFVSKYPSCPGVNSKKTLPVRPCSPDNYFFPMVLLFSLFQVCLILSHQPTPYIKFLSSSILWNQKIIPYWEHRQELHTKVPAFWFICPFCSVWLDALFGN